MDLNTTGIIYHSATNAYHHISQTIKKSFRLKSAKQVCVQMLSQGKCCFDIPIPDGIL